MALRSVQISGTGQLLELQRRLRAAGKEGVRSSMQRRIRRAGEPLQQDLQATVRGLQITSQGGGRSRPSPTTRPLRATIAASIRISVRTTPPQGAKVWVDYSALPADMRGLPAALNTGRLRHPVFGNRHRWVTQWVAPSPWWDKTLRAHQPRMRAEIDRITSDIKSRLT